MKTREGYDKGGSKGIWHKIVILRGSGGVIPWRGWVWTLRADWDSSGTLITCEGIERGTLYCYKAGSMVTIPIYYMAGSVYRSVTRSNAQQCPLIAKPEY